MPVKLAVNPQRMLADLQHLSGPGRAGKGVNRCALVGSRTGMAPDDHMVLIPSGPVHDPLVTALEARGLDVPRLPDATVRIFVGSLRCACQPPTRY